MTSHQAKPPVASPYDYGWQKGSNGPTPILFSGLMSSDFLQDLICNASKGAVFAGSKSDT
jgi:hypothetical protein